MPIKEIVIEREDSETQKEAKNLKFDELIANQGSTQNARPVISAIDTPKVFVPKRKTKRIKTAQTNNIAVNLTDNELPAYEYQWRSKWGPDKGPMAIDQAIRKTLRQAEKNDRPPVIQAVFTNTPALIEPIAAKGNNINAKDKKTGATAIILAIQHGYYDAADILLNNRADVTINDNSGRTPLHIAAYVNQIRLAKRLIKDGAYIDAPDDNLTTPLMIAARKGGLAMVELLLLDGAKPNLLDVDNMTASDYARYKEYDLIVGALSNSGGRSSERQGQRGVESGIYIDSDSGSESRSQSRPKKETNVKENNEMEKIPKSKKPLEEFKQSETENKPKKSLPIKALIQSGTTSCAGKYLKTPTFLKERKNEDAKYENYANPDNEFLKPAHRVSKSVSSYWENEDSSIVSMNIDDAEPIVISFCKEQKTKLKRLWCELDEIQMRIEDEENSEELDAATGQFQLEIDLLDRAIREYRKQKGLSEYAKEKIPFEKRTMM